MKAYPHDKHFSDTHSNDFMNGMDLRDFFAAHAMQGFVGAKGLSYSNATYARWSYELADHMMEARNAK